MCMPWNHQYKEVDRYFKAALPLGELVKVYKDFKCLNCNKIKTKIIDKKDYINMDDAVNYLSVLYDNEYNDYTYGKFK